MFIILGSGINGLLLAQRCRGLKKPFVIIGEGLLTSNNRQGFFYAHKPNPFTYPRPYPIHSTAHPGGSSERYAKKVYGRIPHSRVSYEKYAKNNEVIGEGWLYQENLLKEGIGESFFKDRVIRISRGFVQSLSGRCWNADYTILNTIPLKTLVKLLPYEVNEEFEELGLESKPIYIQHQEIKSWLDLGIYVEYCAADCHPWYRQTGFSPGVGLPMKIAQEFSDVPEGTHETLRPGKIWFSNEIQESDTKRFVEGIWEDHGIYCYGRYATWTPKGLSSDVWEDSPRLQTLYKELW